MKLNQLIIIFCGVHLMFSSPVFAVSYTGGNELPESGNCIQGTYKEAGMSNMLSNERLLHLAYTILNNVTMEHLDSTSLYLNLSDYAGSDHPLYLTAIGYCHENGIGTVKDAVTAVSFYTRASDLGHPRAQYLLGRCCEFGRGTNLNLCKAVTLYRRSASMGDRCGQLGLGLAYHYGILTILDHNKSFHYFEQSALSGETAAWHYLGECYEYGLGTRKNKLAAKQCYETAAVRGCLLSVKALKRF